MVAANPRLNSTLCARVSILLSDAHIAALSARQSQSFQRKLSSHARNAAGNGLFCCSVLALLQEIFLFIGFSSLSPRGGIRALMVRSTVPECNKPQRNHRYGAHQRNQTTCWNLCGETSSVPIFCTRISNAPAIVALSMPSWPPVLYMCDSRILPVGSL